MKLLIVSRAAQPLFGTEATDVARWVSNLSSHSPSATAKVEKNWFFSTFAVAEAGDIVSGVSCPCAHTASVPSSEILSGSGCLTGVCGLAIISISDFTSPVRRLRDSSIADGAHKA